MEKTTWINQQLKAWGFATATVVSRADKVIYLKNIVAEALTEEQLNILGLVPTKDNNMFNTLRHNVSKTAMVAFNY